MSTREDMLELSLGLNTKAAVEAINQYTKAFDRDFKRLERINKQGNKKLLGASKTYWAAQKAAADANEKASKKVAEAGGKLIGVTNKIAAKEQELAAARSANNQQQVREFEEQLEYLNKIKDKFSDLKDDAEDAAEAASEAIKKALDQDIELNFSVTTKGVGEGIAEAFSSFASKDALGIGAGLGKAAGKGILAAMRKVGGAAAAKGQKLSDAQGAGSVAKGIGGLLKAIGPVMNTIGKLGPILGLVGGAVMSLIKLFIDAEAAAKDFNRSVLATSSTMEFLAESGGRAGAAAIALGQTLEEVRDAAFDLSNISLGINKDDYAAVLTSLTEQGYTLKRLKDNAKATGNSVKDVTQDTVKLAVAYSRNMGVSIQEVASLQGELMGQLGVELGVVQQMFGSMSRDAVESGIATNQFFAIIRAMSADMSLFNNRMDSATKILSKLGKVMSARKAQEFLSSIGNFYKGQDLMSRTRHAILGGSDTKKNIQSDINIKMKGLSEDLAGKGIDGNALRTAVKGGMASAVDFLAKNGQKLSGEERGAILDAARMQEKANLGGLVDLASALKDLSPVSALKQLNSGSMRLFGKGLSELTDVQRAAAEQAMGANDEMQDNLAKVQASLDLSKLAIADRIEKNNGTAEEKANDQALLDKLGIKGATAAEKAEALRHADSMTVFDNLDKKQQDLINEVGRQIDYAKKTADFQTDIMKKLGVFIDWAMNELYKLIAGIWDTILDIPGLGGEEHKKDKLLAYAIKTGNQDVITAVSESGTAGLGHKDMFGTKSAQDQQKAIYEGIEAAEKGVDPTKTTELREIMAQGDPVKAAEASKELQALFQEKDKKGDRLNAVFNSINRQVAGGWGMGSAEGKELRTERVTEAATMAGIDPAKAEKLRLASISATDNKDLGAVFRAAGLTGEESAKMLDKLRITLSPEQLAAQIADASKDPAFQATKEGLDASDLSKEATNPGSIYTHDIHLEGLMETLVASLTGGTAGGTDPDMADQTSSIDGLSEEQLEAKEATTASLADIYNVLKIKGIRINQSHLDKDVKKVIFEGSREAMEEALFEYALLIGESGAYKALEDSKGKGGSVTGSGLMRGFAKEMVEGNGLANRKAEKEAEVAAAAVAPPSGGGDKSKDVSGEVTVTGKVVLELKNDLDKYMDARIASWSSAFLQRNPGLK